MTSETSIVSEKVGRRVAVNLVNRFSGRRMNLLRRCIMGATSRNARATMCLHNSSNRLLNNTIRLGALRRARNLSPEPSRATDHSTPLLPVYNQLTSSFGPATGTRPIMVSLAELEVARWHSIHFLAWPGRQCPLFWRTPDNFPRYHDLPCWGRPPRLAIECSNVFILCISAMRCVLGFRPLAHRTHR